MTKQQIRTILEDLYAVDGNLRQYENDLEKIILKILEFKPQAVFDEDFRLELRTRLMAEAERLKQAQPVYGEQFSVWRLFTGKFAYAGVLGAILILVAAGWLANKQGILNLKPRPEPQAISFQKTSLKENAFGSLFGQQDGEAVNQDPSVGFGRGGGGSAYNPSAPPSSQMMAKEGFDIAIGRGGGGGSGFSEPGRPYYIPEYKFVYKGGDIDLPGDNVEVLRRQTGTGGLSDLENMLDALGMGLVNLASFGNLKVQNMNLASEDNLGYSIGIDFQTAAIGISENWPYWEKYLGQQTESLKAADIPSDEKLIAMADEFLSRHGVSKENYGAPEVDNNFKFGIMAETRISAPNQTAQGNIDSAIYPASEAIQVIYPLKINGQTVYDEGGNKTGLYVNINIRAMRASGLWNLTSQSYEASMYEAQTDKTKIIAAAENGGVWGPRYYDDNVNVNIVEVELGTPYLGYSSIWNYQSGKSSLLLVPALIFPITKIPSEVQYFYQKNIVIPLAKEFFDRQNDIPVPLPMPLEKIPAELQSTPDTR